MELLKLFYLIMIESLSRSAVVRVPEPSMEMSTSQNIESFLKEGSSEGVLFPIYLFNYLQLNSLVPYGGTVLDLGCGAAQFVTHLAKLRPDVRFIGIDISQEMLSLGQNNLRVAGVEKQVTLLQADMCNFTKDVASRRIDLICSLYSLHHLPTAYELGQCLQQINTIYQKDRCAVWLFDLCRPHNHRTAPLFTEVFSPLSSVEFNKDTQNSLKAAFSFSEIKFELQNLFKESFVHEQSRILKLFQIHSLNTNKGKKEAPAIDFQTVLTPQITDVLKKLQIFFPKEKSVYV